MVNKLITFFIIIFIVLIIALASTCFHLNNKQKNINKLNSRINYLKLMVESERESKWIYLKELEKCADKNYYRDKIIDIGNILDK